MRRDGGIAALAFVVSLLFGAAAHAQGGLLDLGYWATEIFFERCDVEKGRVQFDQALREVETLVGEGYSRKRILEIARTIPEDCASTSFAAVIRGLDPTPPPEPVELPSLEDDLLTWFGVDVGTFIWLGSGKPGIPPLPVVRFDHGVGRLKGNLLLAANLEIGVRVYGLPIFSGEVYFVVGGLKQGGRTDSFAAFVVGGGVTVFPTPYPSEIFPVNPSTGVGGSFGGMVPQRWGRPSFRVAVEPRVWVFWHVYGDPSPFFEIAISLGGAR